MVTMGNLEVNSRQIISTLATVELKMFSHELKEVTQKLNVRLGQVNCP